MPSAYVKLAYSGGEKFCVNPTVELIQSLAALGIKANSFELKAGRYPGHGWLLFVKEDITDLLDKEDLVLTITDGVETVQIDGLLIADTFANHPRLSDQSLILAKIVDTRAIAIQMKTRLSKDPFPPHEALPPPTGVVNTWEAGIGVYWDNTNIRTSYSAVSKANADFPDILLRDVNMDIYEDDWN
jgi:hypothetical protein